MEKIIKMNGYVYLVEGDRKGFETYYNMGKDPDDPRWEEDEEIIEVIDKGDIVEIKHKNAKSQKKSED